MTRLTFLLQISLVISAAKWNTAAPVGEDKIKANVDKRELGDPPQLLLPAFNPLFNYPTGIGIKPLGPILPPGFFINRFATPDPMATFFKAKKDEFLNKLFDDITIATDAPGLEVRQVTEDPTVTTPKPKIDPSVFITKKFDFLAQLFKTLNTTTTAPDVGANVTTVKPTIVPPGFWVPVTKPPKPPKPAKATKAPIDDATLQAILQLVDTALTKRSTFLEKILPTAAPVETRSVFPPGYWIPPYIYAAKMGIYLDRIFDTIDEAASDPEKRSVDTTLLTELTSLKNDMLAAYLDGLKTTKTTAKKPFWAVKTTPDPIQEKIQLYSDVFDKLAAAQEDTTGEANLTTTTPGYWAPDPTAADLSEYYKSKTQEFLSNLFASKFATTPSTEE